MLIKKQIKYYLSTLKEYPGERTANNIKKQIKKKIKQKQEELNYKILTQQHINKSLSIQELMKQRKIQFICQNKIFAKFLAKATMLLKFNKLQTQQDRKYLQCILFQLQKFTFTHIQSAINDLLIFQFFIKVLRQIFQKQYTNRGFEYRLSVATGSIPPLVSFNSCGPASIALLHYYSVINHISSVELKSTILEYFQSYYKSIYKNKYKNKYTYFAKNINHYDSNALIILLSTINIRQTKTPNQSAISNLCFYIFNQMKSTILSFLFMSPLLKIYSNQYHNFKQYQLMLPSKLSIKQLLMLKYPKLYSSDFNNQLIIVINYYQKFLHIVDAFINLLITDYKNFILKQIENNFPYDFCHYFYMVFLLSSNMEINVIQQKNLHQKWFKPNKISPNEQKKQGNTTNLFQFKLWKVAAKIVESLVKNKTASSSKDKILQLILYKVLDYLKINFKIASLNSNTLKQHKQSLAKIQNYKSSIVKILAYMPIQTIKKLFHKQPATHNNIYESIKICIKQLPNDQKQRDQLIQFLILFAKLKKSLIVTHSGWVQIFTTIIKQDHQYKLWPLYFFIGATAQPTFISLIPFKQIIKYLSFQRQQLQKKSIYIIPQQHKHSKLIQITKLQVSQYIKNKTYSRNWQINVLNLHALTLLTNIQSSLSSLLNQNCQHYKLTINEIQHIFNVWISPFTNNLLLGLNYDKVFQVNDEKFYQFQYTNYKDQPIAYIQKYFYHIFVKNQTFYQFNLIHKILTTPFVQDYLIKLKNNSVNNFFPYFFILIHGFANKQHRKLYLNKYPFFKINPNALREDAIYFTDVSLMTPQLFITQQWSYLIQCLTTINGVITCKQLYSHILQRYHIYQMCSFRIDQPKQSKFNKNQKYLQLNQFMDYHFNQNYTYDRIKPGFRYPYQHFLSINSQIINGFLIDLANPRNYKRSFQNRFAFMLNYLFQLSTLNTKNIKPNIKYIFSQKQLQIINDFLIKYSLQSNVQLSACVYKLSLLDMLKPQYAKKILKTYKFNSLTASNKLICLNLIGKAQAIQQKLVTQQQWNQTIKILGMNKKTKITFRYAYNSLKFTKQTYFEQHINLHNKIINPIYRKMYIHQLIKIQNEYKIQTTINLQQLLNTTNQITQYNFQDSQSDQNQQTSLFAYLQQQEQRLNQQQKLASITEQNKFAKSVHSKQQQQVKANANANASKNNLQKNKKVQKNSFFPKQQKN